MNSFELGKYAALEDMAEMIDDGADLSDLIEAIEYSLDYPLQKNASEDDQAWRLGVESALHDFLSKTAEYYGYMDVQDEEEAILDVFAKVASDVSPDFGDNLSIGEAVKHSGVSSPAGKNLPPLGDASTPNPSIKTKKGKTRNVSDGAPRASNNSRATGANAKANQPKHSGSNSPHPKRDRVNPGSVSPDLDSPSRASDIMSKLKGHGRSAADHLNKYKWRYAAGAGGAAALGAGALLARHLYNKRQEEQESGNSRKR